LPGLSQPFNSRSTPLTWVRHACRRKYICDEPQKLRRYIYIYTLPISWTTGFNGLDHRLLVCLLVAWLIKKKKKLSGMGTMGNLVLLCERQEKRFSLSPFSLLLNAARTGEISTFSLLPIREPETSYVYSWSIME
jgi:hypothetical protein